MKKGSFLRDTVEVLLSAAIVTFILITFVIMPCRVDGSSMYPTLVNDDFGYSFKITKLFGIKRFDIVVIGLDGKKLVKRCIGLPNEKIEYIDNCLYIDGEYCAEDFLPEGTFTDDCAFVLGDNEYLCLGDNRSISRDSRYYGAFDYDQIISNKLFILLPLSRIGVKK